MYVPRHKNKSIKSGQKAPGRAQGRRPPVIDYQNVRLREEEGIESRRGRRFIRWAFDKRLGANQATSVMPKLRQNVNRSFYIRYNYACI